MVALTKLFYGFLSLSNKKDHSQKHLGKGHKLHDQHLIHQKVGEQHHGHSAHFNHEKKFGKSHAAAQIAKQFEKIRLENGAMTEKNWLDEGYRKVYDYDNMGFSENMFMNSDSNRGKIFTYDASQGLVKPEGAVATKEGAAAKEGEPKKGESKEGEPKEGESKEGESKEGEPKEGAPKEGEGESKEGEEESKEGEEESKEGEGESKEGEGESKESESGELDTELERPEENKFFDHENDAEEGAGGFSGEAPDDAKPYRGIDYLGLGYDLIQGNPHGDPYLQIDPGFRAPAAKLEWEENWLTRDNSYNAPKGGWAYPEKSCYQSSSADEITSSADLQNSMSSDTSLSASISGGYAGVSAGVSFSGSTGYKEAQHTIDALHSQRFIMKSYCLQYVASYSDDPLDLPEPVDAFNASCSILPVIESADNITDSVRSQWNTFFKTYGTHFIHRVHMGGKMITEVTIKEVDAQKMKSDGHDTKYAVEASLSSPYVSASVGFSQANSQQEAAKNALNNADKTVKTFVFGGSPPNSDPQAPGAFGAWAGTVQDAPMPIRYEVAPHIVFDCMADKSTSYTLMVADYATSSATFVDPSIGKGAESDGGLARQMLDAGDAGLKAGEMLKAGSDISLKVQSDGNVVIYSGGTALWSTNTYGQSSFSGSLKFQSDGNLVLYKGDGGVLWTSNTWNGGQCPQFIPGSLKLLDTGDLQILGHDGTWVWRTGTATTTDDNGSAQNSPYESMGQYNMQAGACNRPPVANVIDHSGSLHDLSSLPHYGIIGQENISGNQANGALKEFKMNNQDGSEKFLTWSYKTGAGGFNVRSTAPTGPHSWWMWALENHPVSCGDGEILSGWAINSDNNQVYSIAYCLPAVIGQKVNKNTDWQSDPQADPSYFDRVDVKCDDQFVLQRWKWALKVPTDSGQGWRIEYTCVMIHW